MERFEMEGNKMKETKLNPKRHFYLYAKGHYQRGDLIGDLKKIAYDYCGNEVDEDGLIILVASEAYKYLNEHNFLKILREAHPNSIRSQVLDPNRYESYAVRVLTQLLIILNLTVVKEENADGEYEEIISLGEPDPEILPVLSHIINGVKVNVLTVARRISRKGLVLQGYNDQDITDKDGNIGIDVRLQISDSWYLHFGAPDYDIDHRGCWGSSWIPKGCSDEEAMDITRDLIAQAADSYAQSEVDHG